MKAKNIFLNTSKNKVRISLEVCFILILIAENIALFLESTNLEQFLKPLLVPILAINYITNTKKTNFWYLTALFFSFWGYFFIIFNKETYFLNLGTTSFIFSTIIYLIYFFTNLKYKVSLRTVIRIFIVFFISAGIVFYMASPNFGDFFYIGLAKEFFLSFLGVTLFVNYLSRSNQKNFILFLSFFILIFADYMFGIYRFFKNYWFLMNITVTIYYSADFIINSIMIDEGNS